MMRSTRLLIATLGALGAFTTQLAAESPIPPGQLNACPPPTCDDHCKNVPYTEPDCWTTPYGPAAADIILVDGELPPTQSPNMLKCNAGPYALCFYSGPPEATGTNSNNNKLPCVVNSGGNSATCTCQYYKSAVNYVDINGILNLHAYQQAVAQCGPTGTGCANITNSSYCAANPTAAQCQEAAVCQYIRDQNAAKPLQSLVPGADTISDFGFSMASNYNMSGVSPCQDGLYAGCMTAACSFPGGVEPANGGLVSCNCPIVRGTFQIGQIRPDGKPYSCDLGSKYVWSAANTINTQTTKP